MKKYLFLVLAVAFIFSATAILFASDTKNKSDVIEANVWTTADGAKHFTCPVMKNEGIVDENTSFSIVDGKKYYHCCKGCAPKFQADPQKYLKDFSVPANVVKVVENKGKVFQCPVSGEKDVVGEKTVFSDVEGKRYYFCCNNCKTKFDKDPKAFLQSKEKSKN